MPRILQSSASALISRLTTAVEIAAPRGRHYRAKETAMNTNQANVLIHVDETLESGQFSALQGALGGIDGVRAVQPSTKRHLVHVDYDPLATRARAILDQVRRQGLHAQVVGL
jgi:hypothetical protein